MRFYSAIPGCELWHPLIQWATLQPDTMKPKYPTHSALNTTITKWAWFLTYSAWCRVCILSHGWNTETLCMCTFNPAVLSKQDRVHFLWICKVHIGPLQPGYSVVFFLKSLPAHMDLLGQFWDNIITIQLKLSSYSMFWIIFLFQCISTIAFVKNEGEVLDRWPVIMFIIHKIIIPVIIISVPVNDSNIVIITILQPNLDYADQHCSPGDAWSKDAPTNR